MSDETIQRLSAISLEFNRIVPICQLVFGTFGNILNILIFTRQSLRHNPCSMYFLASSVNNLFVLYVATLTRYLSSAWQIDPSNSNVILCKLRMFFVYTSFALIQWFMVLASIDRYLSSSRDVRYRRMSNKSLAQKAIGLTILIVGLAHFHTFIWMSVDYTTKPSNCNIIGYIYEIAFQTFFLVLICILPPMLMSLFGILTVMNVRKYRTQVIPQPNQTQDIHSRAKNRQLIRMLLIQVFVTIFCTLPFSIGNLTSMVFKYLVPLSAYGSAVSSFYTNVSRNLIYCNPIVGFYIYTLSSKTFRDEIKRMTQRTMKFILKK